MQAVTDGATVSLNTEGTVSFFNVEGIEDAGFENGKNGTKMKSSLDFQDSRYG